MIEVVGFLASITAFLLFLPSAKSVWDHRHDAHALEGASVGTNAILICNAILWIVYGALASAFWVAAPSFINLPLAIFTIYLIKKASSKEKVQN